MKKDEIRLPTAPGVMLLVLAPAFALLFGMAVLSWDGAQARYLQARADADRYRRWWAECACTLPGSYCSEDMTVKWISCQEGEVLRGRTCVLPWRHGSVTLKNVVILGGPDAD